MDAPLIYAGSVHFRGHYVKEMFGRSISFRYRGPERNEENLSRQVAAKHFGDFGAPLTILVQRYTGGTIILRTPNRVNSK